MEEIYVSRVKLKSQHLGGFTISRHRAKAECLQTRIMISIVKLVGGERAPGESVVSGVCCVVL